MSKFNSYPAFNEVLISVGFQRSLKPQHWTGVKGSLVVCKHRWQTKMQH